MTQHNATVLAILSAFVILTGMNCTPEGMQFERDVFITSPADGEVFDEVQEVTITVSAEFEIDKVEFRKGARLAYTDTEAPFEYVWDLADANNRTYEWNARAYDAAGNGSSSDAVRLTVAIEDTPPALGEPELVGFIPGVGTARNVVIDGTLAFISSDPFGLSIVDVSNPANLTAVGASPVPSKGTAASVSGDLAVYLGSDREGLAHVWALDVSNPFATRVLGELSWNTHGYNAQDVALLPSGTRAVAAVAGDLLVIDLTDPAPIAQKAPGYTQSRRT